METAGCRSLLFVADGFAGLGARKELMDWQRWLAALFVLLALTGCAPAADGPGKVPNAPYPQDDPRDTSGMH
jgi:hypothetical protein